MWIQTQSLAEIGNRGVGMYGNWLYLETPDDIRILAIAHDRRKPGYWKGRLR